MFKPEQQIYGMIQREKYKAKGDIIFVYTKGEGLITKTREYKEDFEKLFGNKPIYHLMSGEEFVDCVSSGGIMDNDGSIADIFVDGYISNLGLHHDGLTGGRFLVDKEIFLDICKDHKVEVNWANK